VSNLAIQIWPEILRTLDFSVLDNTYMGLGTAIDNPARVYWVQNLTDVQVTFSFDGVNDHFTLPDDGFLLLDSTSNRTNVGGAFAFPTGTRTYVKISGAVAPTKGSVNLTVFYGKNG
jgi:hypothetical protein